MSLYVSDMFCVFPSAWPVESEENMERILLDCDSQCVNNFPKLFCVFSAVDSNVTAGK